MRQDLFEKLLAARDALHEAEADHPDSAALARLHQVMLRGLHRLRHHFGLTDEQFNQLSEPQGGGTPKTPDPEG